MSLFRLLAFLLLFPYLLASQTPASSPLITGTVQNAAGQPLASVRVALLDSSSNAISSTLTNTAGVFQFRSVPPGSLTLVAESAGFAPARVPLTVPSGLGGARVSLELLRPGAECTGSQCVSVTYIRPSEALRQSSPTAKPLLTQLAAASSTAAGTVNSAADFTIQTTIAATSPPRFGFNFAPQSPAANNMFSSGGGMDPYDNRFSFSATNPGTTTTFIDNDCASGCPGTDFYQSIATGYFNGATARVYHFDTTANQWTLINSGTVTSFTANSASTNTVDHTITFNNTGTAATQTGDAVWLAQDGVAAIPDYTKLDPRLQTYGYYSTAWTLETGATLGYMPSHQVGATNLQPFSFVPDGPPGDNDSIPGANSPLSLKITDTNSEFAGIFQYFLGTGANTESLQPGHTYQVTVWLKQTGIANASAYFSLNSGSTIYASTTFTGITGSWKQFTFQFPGFQAPPSTSVNPVIRLDFQAPGSLYVDQLQISDAGFPALTIDPRVMAAWQAYAPSTMRIWTNFGNTGGNYSFWGLNSWLADDSEDHIDPGIGNIYEEQTLHAHLPSSLAIAKTAGAEPWLICNMSLSEAEWGNLIDYLAAPAGTGYAALRPANHPGPYTADFNHIYLEFGNEEWGTQETAVNAHYGQWVHYMLSQAIAGKSYFDPAKIKFIVNGFTIIPSIGSAAVAAAPEASIVDIFTYNQGDATLIPAGATTYPDAYFQTALLSLIRNTAEYGTSLKSLIDAQVAQQKADAAKGLNYSLAVYEGGPGDDIASSQGDTSLAAAVGNLDTSLYSSLLGIQQQNFFLFNFGPGPYSSHSYLWNGFNPHPAWEALQMRNQYAHGDMVNVVANTNPVTTGTTPLPLIGTYAFHEVNSSGQDQLDVFVLSRDLNNATPVTLHLPGVPTGTATLYTLTGDPRANNDSALTIPIAQSSLTGVTQNYAFTMPAGSIYLLQIPLTSYGAAAPVASLTPTSLTFASQTISTTSTSQTVTLSNTGSAALNISAIALTGTNAADFAQTNNCGVALAAAATCSISVTFKPSAAGARTASLVVTDNSGNNASSSQTTSLTGTGSSVVLPTTFTTYMGPYGSGFQTFNTPSVVLPLRAYSPSGFSQLSYFVASITTTSGGLIEYWIYAIPDGAGGYTLRLQNSVAISLIVPITPSGNTVTLPTPLTIGLMQITAYRFALVGNEFQLDLTATRSGIFNDQIALLAVLGNNANYSLPWNISDAQWSASTSTSPTVTLSPSSLAFGSVSLGSTAAQTLTLTNTSTVPLSVSSLQISGTNSADFSAVNSCATVAGGATCSIPVTFAPAAVGSRTATLSLNDNATGSPQTVTLNGAGSTAPSVFTTYLGTYGGTPPVFHGSSVVVPLRAYAPSGVSQLNYLMMSLNAASNGASEYRIYAQTNGAGGFMLSLQNNTTSVPWPLLLLNSSGSTVNLPTPITLGTVSITAYRFALVGNELQLDLSITRTGTFSDQIVTLAVLGNNAAYSFPWNQVTGQWSNP